MISGSSFLFGSFVMGSSMSFTMDFSVDKFTHSSMLDQIQFMKNLLASSEEADVVITYLQLFNQLYKDRKEVMISNSMFNDRVLIERLMKRIGFVSGDYLDADQSNHRLQFQIASEATHTLGLLAREDSAREHIIQVGGVQLIIQNIQQHGALEQLTEYSLFTLGNLSIHEQGKRVMVEHNGIKLVTDLMQNSLASSKILARACFVLGNLAFHENCKKVILQHGGIERTAQAMTAHPDNGPLALEGCFLLSNMSVVKESRELIVASKGVGLILNAIKCKRALPELLELACTALYNLTLSDEGNKQVCESDAVGVLVDMIKASNKDDNFLIEAMGVISRAYLFSEKNKLAVITSGLISMVISIMASSRNPNLKLACFNLLMFLSNPESIKYETRPIGVSSLLEMSARSVLNRSESATSDVTQLSLPSELIDYLTQRPRPCDQCGRNYFDYHYQLITFKRYDGFTQKLPVMNTLCSENCVHEMKQRSYADVGPNRGTLK
eukprot:TRINITY_DN11014_c0_g1_i1.p1 TRINITY_DN11014_c0_g1~~TRINITY_DN11014_c0_g1_i1.p1  ORF type:complete len:497 (+),score=71.96 TRINITY_DN11014_c0_g1_i1:107-1597(+)